MLLKNEVIDIPPEKQGKLAFSPEKQGELAINFIKIILIERELIIIIIDWLNFNLKM